MRTGSLIAPPPPWSPPSFPRSPVPPEGFTIRGGAGMLSADPPELRAAATELRRVAELLDDAAALVQVAEVAVSRGVADSPGTARSAHRALDPLRYGPASLPRGADRTRELALALDRTAALYGDAEGAAGGVVRALLSAVGGALGEHPLVAAVGAFAVARAFVAGVGITAAWRLVRGEPIRPPSARGLRELAVRLPGEPVMAFTGGFVRGLAPGPQLPLSVPVPDASRKILAGTALAALVVPALRRRPMQVTARVGVPQGPSATSAAEAIEEVGSKYPLAGGSAGTIGVDRRDRADGTTSWVVVIPGTETWGMGWDDFPMDLSTDVRLLAGSVDDGTELVRRALEQAGVPPGDPVLLAGHSQGGMVALALAADDRFTAKYYVAAVLTAGSPVVPAVVPAGIPVLQVEHRTDLVVAADGRPAVAAPNVTTATRDLGASSDPADRVAAHDPVASHSIPAYARTARDLSALGGESVRAWEAAAAQVWEVPAATTRMEFTGTRLSATGSHP